jgi:hypothetical protein
MKPCIYADFQNTTQDGRIRLNGAGTRMDLERLGLQLQDGMSVTLYTDDGEWDDGLTIAGVVECVAGDWTAVVDWDQLERKSLDQRNRSAVTSR